jgi:hypothetical protein
MNMLGAPKYTVNTRIPECLFFQAQTALLLNDGALPTASIFTESFSENFLLNGASLPISAHKSVPFLYQFLVLTTAAPASSGPPHYPFIMALRYVGSRRCRTISYRPGRLQTYPSCRRQIHQVD